MSCIGPNGYIDSLQFSLYIVDQAKQFEARKRLLFKLYNESVAPLPTIKDDYDEPPAKKTRFSYFRCDPKESRWWKLYIASGQCGRCWRSSRLFRRRFGIPWVKFMELVEIARLENWFPNIGSADCMGRVGAPLELLFLGSLRYLRRGWTFDDLAESTGISEEVHRRFFHKFCRVGATTLFSK